MSKIKEKDLFDSDYHLLEISNWEMRDRMLLAFALGLTVMGLGWFFLG